MPVYSVSVYVPTRTYRVKADNEHDARNGARWEFEDEDMHSEATSVSYLGEDGPYDVEGFPEEEW